MTIERYEIDLNKKRKDKARTNKLEPSIEPGYHLPFANYDQNGNIVLSDVVCDSDDSEGRIYELDPRFYSYSFDSATTLRVLAQDDSELGFLMEHKRTISENFPQEVFIRNSMGEWTNKMLLLVHKRTFQDS